jgi:hypothetical protein
VVAYADCEPAIDDIRLAIIEDKVKRFYPQLEEAEFFTARVLNPQGVWEVHFQVHILYPKEPQRSLGIKTGMKMQAAASDWDSYEKEREHYRDARPDVAMGIFMKLGEQVTGQLQSIRELITDDIDRKRVVMSEPVPSPA